MTPRRFLELITGEGSDLAILIKTAGSYRVQSLVGIAPGALTFGKLLPWTWPGCRAVIGIHPMRSIMSGAASQALCRGGPDVRR